VLKLVVGGLAAALGLLGVVFLLAAGQGNAVVRAAIGGVCLVAAAALLALARLKPIQQTHVHEMKLDLPGAVKLEQSTCQQCGAVLTAQSTRVAAGAIYVHCEYCGAEYQLEEEPRW